MARTLDSRELCARALRMIGEFPTSETAPDGEQLREALFWLDLVMASNAGLRDVFFLRPATVELTLTPGQRDYSLATIMGDSFPSGGISFPTGCQMLWPGPQPRSLPVPIVRREMINSVGSPDEVGVPRMIWIDRLAVGQRLVTWPTLPAAETQIYKLLLDFQAASPDLSPAGVSGARPNGTTITGVRTAWQQWVILKLASALGSGPINKQSATQIALWERQAAELKVDLDAFENQEHQTTPPIVQSYGIDDYEADSALSDSYDSYRIPSGRFGGYLA